MLDMLECASLLDVLTRKTRQHARIFIVTIPDKGARFEEACLTPCTKAIASTPAFDPDTPSRVGINYIP
jgi:hypothetical protein